MAVVPTKVPSGARALALTQLDAVFSKHVYDMIERIVVGGFNTVEEEATFTQDLLLIAGEWQQLKNLIEQLSAPGA